MAINTIDARRRGVHTKVDPVVLLRRTVDLDLSTRSTNALVKANILYVGDLACKTVQELMSIKNMGRTCASEIKERLKNLNLTLDMDIPCWPLEDLEKHVKAIAKEITNRKRREAEEYWEQTSKNIKTLEDEILFFLQPISSHQHKQIVMRFFGWDGRGRNTLESVGRDFGLTRERIRQVRAKCEQELKQFMKQGGLPFTTLERVINYILEHTPSDLDAIETGLVDEGITRDRFSLEGVQTLAEFLGRDAQFATVSLGSKRFTVRSDDRQMYSILTGLSKKAIGHWGMANISDVVAQTEGKIRRTVTGDMVLAAISSYTEFQWLDKPGGWFWSAAVPKNRLLNLIKKILSVAGELDVTELRAGIGRSCRMNNFLPPTHVLLELCRQLPWCRVEATKIAADPPLDWETTLEATEWAVCSVLKEHQSVMSRADLEKECLGLGMNHHTFEALLSNSPILSRPCKCMYALRGTDVRPGFVGSRTGPRNGKKKTTLDFGWTDKGEISLLSRISAGTLRSGVLSIPTPLTSYLGGSFNLRLADGSRIGTIKIKGTSGWSLYSFFRRRGVEAGKYLALVFNLSSREAILSLGNEDLLHGFESHERHAI